MNDAIVLNGASSSGKTSIARVLQARLRKTWLNFSIDSVLYALPPTDLQAMIDGTPIARADHDFNRLVLGYHAAAAALLRTGNRLIIDNATSRATWREDLVSSLRDFRVLWVGVRCDVDVARTRELARGDRAVGTAERETLTVHNGFVYDLEVDTTVLSADQAAAQILEEMARRSATPVRPG